MYVGLRNYAPANKNPLPLLGGLPGDLQVEGTFLYLSHSVLIFRITCNLKYVTIATRHSLYLINKVYTSKPSNCDSHSLPDH